MEWPIVDPSGPNLPEWNLMTSGMAKNETTTQGRYTFDCSRFSNRLNQFARFLADFNAAFSSERVC